MAPTPALPSLKTRLKHGIKTVFTIKTSLYKGFKRKRVCEELVVRRDHSSGRQPSPRGSPARKHKCVSVAAGLGRGGAGHRLGEKGRDALTFRKDSTCFPEMPSTCSKSST